jgi:long-chain fatty acid transport protein
MGYRVPWLVGWVLVLTTASGLRAQTNDESNAGVQFNFSTPGARSLAMGGAFLGSVDDASAAYSNPAGLLQLTRPEALVEGRRWQYATPYAVRGRASGEPSERGADTIDGVELDEAESELQGISYAAYVHTGDRWAAAGFYHQLARFESSFTTEGIFTDGGRRFPIEADYGLNIRQAGFAFAREWRPGVSGGLSLTAMSLELDSLTQRYSWRGDFYRAIPREAFVPVNFQTQEAGSQELGVVAGLRWDPAATLSVGLVYRAAPTFDIAVSSIAGSPERPGVRFVEGERVPFNVPDSAGMGFSLRPSQAWTLNFDLTAVFYSELNQAIFLFFTRDELGRPITPENYQLDDTLQLHFGAEHVADRWRLPVALRFGLWYDPDHRLRFEGASAAQQATFFEGEPQVHVTGGLGIAIGARFQLDLAVDVAEIVKSGSVSLLYRF